MSDGIRGLRTALPWGLVGGLSFLVLLQGYELVTSERVAILVKAAVTVAVTVGATLLVTAVRPYLVRWMS